MEVTQVETIYTSVCASQRENNIKSRDGYLLFSSNRCPVLYQIKTRLATHLLGHTDEVNGTCFIDNISDSDADSTGYDGNYLVSTSYDGSAIIWELIKTPNEVEATTTPSLDYKILHQFKSQTKNCFSTRSCIRRRGTYLSVTSSIDGNLSLWSNDELSFATTLKYCCFHSVIHQLGEYLLLFLAGSDNRVHIFQITPAADQLIHLLDLVGHQDWIKGVDVLGLGGGEVLLASASQDLYLRVWHVRLLDSEQIKRSKQAKINQSPPLEQPEQSRGRRHQLTASLETVLSGHEGIVHGVCWFKRQPGAALQLVSCSADKTVIVWRSEVSEARLSRAQAAKLASPVGPDSADDDDTAKIKSAEDCHLDESVSAGLWKEAQRLGETGETNLPFLSVCLSPDESTLYAQSLHGAIHSWNCRGDGGGSGNPLWVPDTSITGHFGPITDLAWDSAGGYLLSCSLDKTCRLHGLAKCNSRWHELARPQVHGHELNCVASLGFTRFASGADEKTIRVFEATQFFMKNYAALSATAQVPLDGVLSSSSLINQLPIHAQLPALGLSNRGAQRPYDTDNGDSDKAAAAMASNWYKSSELMQRLANIEHLSELPQEEVLLQSTLWWEANKLYGHGNELYALAADSTASFIASASKANRPDLAQVLVWELGKFRRVASIEHHTLTVTKLRFSPNSKYLLSVSRDRTWCVSVRSGQVRDAYTKLLGTTKSNSCHERIIWDCCWTADSSHFITVSRDKKALLWSMEALLLDGAKIDPVSSKLFDSSIQAVDCCSLAARVHLFAFGLEDGSLELSGITMNNNGLQWLAPLRSLAKFHHMPIRRLTFKPSTASAASSARPAESTVAASGGSGDVTLASSADDCMVKVTRIVLQWNVVG